MEKECAMLKLFAMMLAFLTTLVYFDVDFTGGAWSLLCLFAYFVIAQVLINLVTAKLHFSLPAQINSRGIDTIALIVFYSFVNGLLILLFAKTTNLIHCHSFYEPFISATSMMLIRQLFD